MKIVHINSGYGRGGAGIAATRLYQQLKTQYNLDMKYFCTNPNLFGLDEDIINPFQEKRNSIVINQTNNNSAKQNIGLFALAKQNLVNSRLGLELRDLRDRIKKTETVYKYGFMFGQDCTKINKNFIEMVIEFNPDIIHLHWIISMLSLENIETMVKATHAKIVWTTHDMWAYTGGCHYNLNITHNKTINFCDKWQTHCKNCPNIHGKVEEDKSFQYFNNREKHLKNLDITFISPALWAKNHLSKSSLFSHKKSYHIPNPYDIEIFKPYDLVKSRTLFNLPLDKKLILFGNIYNKIKGGLFLDNALQHLSHLSKNIVLVSFGKNNQVKNKKFSCVNVGEIKDEKSLAKLYSACDVMAVPSIIDIGPSTAIEAMLCETPVVAFDVYGPAEYIEHKINGYLATHYNTKDFARGLEFVLFSNNTSLSKQARKKAVTIFEKTLIAKKHMEVYNTILRR